MDKESIKKVAVAMVRESGLINLTRAALCERAGIPAGSFPHVAGCTFTELVRELQSERVFDATSTPVVRRRTDPTLRKEHILSVAVDMSQEQGYNKITRDGLAERAGVSAGLVTKYFGTMNQLRRDVMRRAIARGLADIVAQGLANRDAHAQKAPAELKAEAATLIANY